MRKPMGTLVLLIVSAMVLASCGGGGGGTAGGGAGEASPLTVTEKVSVVDAQSGGSSSPSRAPGRYRAPSPPPVPSTSDYYTDRANVYVEERSVDAFNTVNEILCMIAQTRYDAMLNQGPYKAQVDSNQCKGRDSASAGGQASANQSSGANMPDYEMWTVDSSRADNASPQILKAWIHEPAGEHDPEKVIHARAVITEGVSSTNPYGIFTINFKAFPVVGGVEQSTEMFKGVLKSEVDSGTGKVVLKFFDVGGFTGPEGAVSFTERVAIDRSSASSGGGKLYTQNVSPGGTQTKSFSIAFNDNNFLREGGGTVCLDRKNFDSSAWRYGVYDGNGARVALNSGFPVRLSRSGTDYRGWIGYWGAWFQDNVTLVNGETVYKQTFGPGGGTETAYQVLVAGGKLKKHTRKTLVLGDIVNIPLDLSEFDQASGTDNQFRVLWDGAKLSKIARLNRTNYTWEDITAVDIDMAALRYPELFFWSQALGGSVQVKLQGCTPVGTPPNNTFSCTADNATPVISYAEVVVSPADTIPSTLACFENCPDAASLGGQNPFKTTSAFQQVAPGSAAYASYTFNSGTMLLLDGGSSVVSSASSTAYPWGLMSGPLFDPTSSNLTQLACGWDNTGNTTCAWQARSNLSVYYTWETGPNNWNQLVALQSGGTTLSFDPPLQLSYTHLEAGKYQNAKFYLEYSGFGDLHGIPGTCVDMDTGTAADCSQGGPGSSIRWVPEFTVPDGSVMTASGATYYVKALDKEQRMMVSAGGCSGLDVTPYAALTLPTIAEWVDPTTGSGSIGSEPSVTGAPAVVGGVLQ
ncbi:MAG: hypothetical protein HZB63_08135 [Deltaproteobacteria bacterium]|nr:hypothetical protein [Deltaproteobacteria bacterium]